MAASGTLSAILATPTYGWEGPDKAEVLLSSDGASWNRWEPSEFGRGADATEAWLVGVGTDFVVVQAREWDEVTGSGLPTPYLSLWVGRLP